MSDDIKEMNDKILILLNIINDKLKRIEELEQQLKELPKKICDEIEKFAYDTYKEFGVFDETDLQHILEEIRARYTKEQKT